MKKFLAIFASLIGLSAVADTYTYTTTLTNGQPISYSDALPVSGWLDKIEVATESASTTTVTVATYSGTTAVDTFYTSAINGTNPVKVARPRVVGTDSTGANLTAAAFAIPAGVSTNGVGTVISVPYDRPMIGGNIKVATTGTANDGSCPVTVTLFYLPTPK